MKRGAFTLLLIASVFILTACASGGSGSTTEPGPSASAPESDTAAEQTMIYGEIYETIGNLVTLKIIETPENLTELLERMSEAGERIVMADGERASFGEGVERPAFSGDGEGFSFSLEGVEGGERPQIQWQGEGEKPHWSSMTFPSGMPGMTLEEAEPAYTGEQEDIIIPVGVPVVTISRGENGSEETEVSLDSLKSGDKLLVYCNESTGIVEKVTLLNTLGMGMNGARVRQFMGADGAAGATEWTEAP